MSDDNLKDLREKIDRLDGQLLELIQERAALVRRVGMKKGPGAPIVRPGREAAVLRDKLDRLESKMPAATVASIWRELMSAACFMQGGLKVALYAPERPIAHWDLARKHFGTVTPIQLCGSPQRVLQEAGENGVIGVLPWPEYDEAQPWWPNLAAEDSAAMNIVGVLPFFESASGRFEALRLMAVATYPPEPSGDDLSYLIVQADLELSMARLNTLLSETGLQGRILASQTQEGLMRHLLELDGFVTGDDTRLNGLSGDETIRQIKLVGAAARPVGVLDEEESPA